jgi:flagellar basal-body rod modification protein FlgD
METSAIGTSTSASPATQQGGLSSLKSEDFFKILVTELQNQDPFEPTKTADMISQVSQIRSIELSGKLTDTLGLMTRQQRLSGTSELIGKYVYAVTTAADGTQMLHQGVVTGLRFNADGAAVLELDTGEMVPATAVIRVTTLDEVELEAAAAQVEEEGESADKAEATERQRDSGQSWLNLEGALRL